MLESETSTSPILAMVGFGEAARAFASGWGRVATRRMGAFDVKSLDSAEAPGIRGAYVEAGIQGFPNIAALVTNAPAVLCLVTADQSVAVATSAAPHIGTGTYWFDGNSCSPATKRRAAAVIAAAQGRYVDMAIMAPVYPKLHRTPVFISGPDAEGGKDLLSSLGMDVRIVGSRIGDASAVKMVRSVMIKGIEALTAECLLAARRACVDREVLASLEASNSAASWEARSLYNLERMMTHGVRRAAEMREAAATLQELGLPARMAAATAEWEDKVGSIRLGEMPAELSTALDLVLAAM